MKKTAINLVMASLMMLTMNSCDKFPVTQEGKVKKAATAYIEENLKDGEQMSWGSSGLRLHVHVDGQTYTYTEVTYTLSADGKETPKTLYVLLSENCDELIAATDQKPGERQEGLWKSVDEAMGQSAEDTKQMLRDALKD